jgi:hypothetical protein
VDLVVNRRELTDTSYESACTDRFANELNFECALAANVNYRIIVCSRFDCAYCSPGKSW